MVTWQYILLTWAVVPVLSYPSFQTSIPNGEGVPHPCKPNYIWRGVGHKNQLGGGERNPFGEAFEANDKVWTEEFCRMDSDGDGKTNGQELGDPDCVWTPGSEPTYKYGLSHPGICEPFNTTLCGDKPDYVNCEYEEFECEHPESEQDMFNFTVRMPETEVPATETTYLCIVFEFPKDQADTYHIIANKPVIDNEHVMHHMIITGICDVIGTPPVLNEPFPCGMGGRSAGWKLTCSDTIGAWTVGTTGQCIPPETGFLVGGETGYKYGMIQYHWNNPQELSTYKDSSGMTFYATPKLRQYNAGIFSIGQSMLVIPPGLERHEEHGGCSSMCTEEYMSGDIKIFSVTNHMHYLGRAQITTLNKTDGSGVYVANDQKYSYDSPVTHTYSEGVVMKPGDALLTTCVFKSTSRTTVTYFGESTSEEMCLSFFSYYPKENFKKNACRQLRSLDWCAVRSGIVNGCNFDDHLDLSNPQTAETISYVQKHCIPTECRQECLDYVRDVKQQPCFKGDVDMVLRQRARQRIPGSKEWYAALDSCNDVLLSEQLEQENNNGQNGNDDTSSGNTLIYNYLILTVIIVFIALLTRL